MTLNRQRIRNFTIMRRLIVFVILLSFSLPSKASHVIGYDFDYVYIGSNTYRFTLSIFRDCRPVSQGGGTPGALIDDSPAYISIFEGSNFSQFDSSFANNVSIVPPFFSNDCVNDPPNRCNSKMVFVFERILAPSPVGYTVIYQRCCRNASTLNIVNPGITGNSFICRIPANDNGNNSARFKNTAPQIICINNPLFFDCSASDFDGDSLSYEFCNALKGGSHTNSKPLPPNLNFTNIQYQPPYSAQYPMSANPALSINPVTGAISGTPTLQGIYAISVCCKEWRNGVAINTVRREFQVNVTNCSKAVVAKIPVLAHEPNTFQINCKDRVVNFVNNSTGGFAYEWDFGVPGITTDVSNLESPTYVYPDTGTFVVKLVVNPGSTCPDSIERIVKIYPTFDADFSFTGLFCPELPINFMDQSSSTNFPINYWAWDFDDGTTGSTPNLAHSFPNSGREFKVTLESGNTRGCRDRITKNLNIPLVNLDAGNDTVILQDEFIQYNATGTQTYNWSPADFLDNSNIGNPIGLYPDTGRYQYIITGLTAEGCPGRDTLNVIVSEGAYVIIPNAFTPNGDGNNDILRMLSSGFKKINHFRIFNRWGQKVFETNDYYNGWDGRVGNMEQQTSTFFWVVSVIDLDDKVRIFQGDVTLIR